MQPIGSEQTAKQSIIFDKLQKFPDNTFNNDLESNQYGRLASFGRFNCTFSLFIPIWKPFIAWMAACALAGLS